MKNLFVRFAVLALSLLAAIPTNAAEEPTPKVTVCLTHYAVVYETPGWGKYTSVEFVCDFNSPAVLKEVVGHYRCNGDGCREVFHPAENTQSKEGKEWTSLEARFKKLGVGFRIDQTDLGYAATKDERWSEQKFTLVGSSFSHSPTYVLKSESPSGELRVFPLSSFATSPPEGKTFGLYRLNGKILPVMETTDMGTNGVFTTVGTVELFSRRNR